MLTLHLYCLGHDPYGDGGGISRWGERKGKFPDMESALHGLLVGHPYPTALTGRFSGVFIPGVSLKDVPEAEVIQVWSTEPRALANIANFSKSFPDVRPKYWPHTGDGTNVGLLAEIHIKTVREWQRPAVAGLLTDGSGIPASASAAGAFTLSFTPQNLNALQVRLFKAQLASFGAEHRAGESIEVLQGHMARFGEGMRMMKAYISGTHGLQTLARGERAPAELPYSIFQSRLFLTEELGLIANLIDMDHRDMDAIDSWLMRSERWKKLLPLPKCILVTRICRERKEYREEGAFEAAYHNHFNMESLVWIRDGDNVWRFATDIQFEDRVFPAGDDAPALARRIQEKIWQEHWNGARRRGREEWAKRSRHSNEEPVAPTRAPENEREPVEVRWLSDVEYPTLDAYLASEHYTPELDAYIRRRANDGARQYQREMMPFALLLQGLIDQKNLLNIPPGTDIFDPENHRRFIRLVNDFSDGLADDRFQKQWDALTKEEALRPGDRIIGWRWACYTEHYSHVARWNHGSRTSTPMVFTFHHLVSAEDAKDGRTFYPDYHRLHVHEWELSRRWVSNTGPFTKKLATASIDMSRWIPVGLPASLAERLLDDRNWKRTHLWAVPLLAQWSSIQRQLRELSPSPAPVPLKLRQVGDTEDPA